MPTPNEDPLEPDRFYDDPDNDQPRLWRGDPRQLWLFAPRLEHAPAPESPPGTATDPEPETDAEPEFVRGARVDRSGINRYIHIVRGPDDPLRSPRPQGGLKDRAPHRTFKKMPIEKAVELLLSLLSDGRPRTFNAMTIELFDLGADTLMGSPVDRALWKLVAAERIEHTMSRPVLFRLAT